MEKSMRKKIYGASFFLNLHYAFLLYINSSFLAQFFSSEKISLLYVVSAVVTMILLGTVQPALRSLHRSTVSLVLAGAAIFSAYAITLTRNPIAIAGFFVILNATIIALRFLLDIYLEQYSSDTETGSIRAINLTATNLAVAISPFLVGMLLVADNFANVYRIASILLVPTFFIILFGVRKHAPHIVYDTHSPLSALGYVFRKPVLRALFLSNYLLEFFYAWMVIYTPIYLSQTIGFSWESIGTIFSIMLLSFVIFEIPLGNIADRWNSESEILSIGFCMMALFTAALAFLSGANIIAWIVLLFMTRVGAAAVEVTSESGFFKNVSGVNANLIGAFRSTRPLALISAPILGSIVLAYGGYKAIFLSLAAIMLIGIKLGFQVKNS
jgi:predicted MFS family arabinose efflux permease